MVLWSSCKILQHKHKSHNIKVFWHRSCAKIQKHHCEAVWEFYSLCFVSQCLPRGWTCGHLHMCPSVVHNCMAASSSGSSAERPSSHGSGTHPAGATAASTSSHCPGVQPCWSGKIFRCKTKFDWIKHSAFSWMTIAEVFFWRFLWEGYRCSRTPSSPSRALSGVSVSAPLATLGNCVGHWWPRQQSGADGDLDQVLPVGFLPEDEGRAAEPPNPQLFSTSGLILCV